MLDSHEKGKQFYYADRNQGKPVKCIIVDYYFQHPLKITAVQENL